MVEAQPGVERNMLDVTYRHIDIWTRDMMKMKDRKVACGTQQKNQTTVVLSDSPSGEEEEECSLFDPNII